MTYAILAEDGRQIKVEPGQELYIDLREGTPGQVIKLEKVLAVRTDAGLKIGQPVVAGASVDVEILGVKKGPKLVVQKMRRRKNFRKKTGHRQAFTQVKVTSINA